MTKKLEELLDLAPATNEQVEQTPTFDVSTAEEQLNEANNIIDKIDSALPTVKELDAADDELDELSDIAKQRFQDLMDLGMNVEARHSGTILQTAGTLLGHAITAKQAKIDKKLRMVDLQLKKMRLDQQKAKDKPDNDEPLDSQGMVLDRNELLKQILDKGSKS
jgi:hypothetical protein